MIRRFMESWRAAWASHPENGDVVFLQNQGACEVVAINTPNRPSFLSGIFAFILGWDGYVELKTRSGEKIYISYQGFMERRKPAILEDFKPKGFNPHD